MARVLFVCVRNAGRSQMAAAVFARAAGNRHAARSAGSDPADRVHPEVIEVMDEVGIDLRTLTPRRLSDDDGRWADVVVTMGCGDACPLIPGRRYLDWSLPDPAGQDRKAVRAIRDEIADRVRALVRSLDRDAPTPPHDGTP